MLRGKGLKLGSCVSWLSLAELLDMPLRDRALPARTNCPLCQKDGLVVYDDGDGQWASCLDCGFADDMLGLAAAAWKVEIPTALRKLEAAGIHIVPGCWEPEALDQYVRAAERRKQFSRFWAEAKAFLAAGGSGAVSRLKTLLHLDYPINPDRWRTGPAELMGAATQRMAIARLYGDALRKQRHPSMTEFRLFKQGWNDVIVLPFHDLPGRLSGFYFVGKDGGASGRIFRSLRRPGAASQDAGLHGLWAIEKAKKVSGKYVIALEDPVLAMRLHVRHFNVADTPLPIVAWLSGPAHCTTASWQSLSDKTVIFWGWKLTPGMIRHAYNTDGWISLTGPRVSDEQAVNHYLRHDPAADLIRIAVRKANTWQVVFSNWVMEQPDGVVEDMLIKLELQGLHADALAQACPGIAERLAILSPRDVPFRTAIVNGVKLVERDGGWFVCPRTGGWKRYMEAVLRLDELIVTDGVAVYRGRILFRGSTVTFCEAAEKIASQQMSWVRTRLAEAGLSVLPPPESMRKVSIVDAALAFHTPVTARPPAKTDRPTPASPGAGGTTPEPSS